MTGKDIQRFRERRNLEAGELAESINAALGTDYTEETIKRWERSNRKPAAKVRAFLEELAVEGLAGELGATDDLGADLGDDDRPLDEQPAGAGDTSPGGPAMPPAAPKVGGSSTWAKACEELWELVATGVGMVGAATGNPALMRDGEIIAADKAALGAAWGRLAETNETFRRMLVGMTEGGVWLQVAMVTGTTLSKCWQSHQQYADYLRRQRAELGLDGAGEPAAAAA